MSVEHAGAQERRAGLILDAMTGTEYRPGWIREVELPDSLDELRGPTAGVVWLPLRIYWSGPDPEGVEWNMGRRERRARLYEVVLREGDLDDIRALVDGGELVRIWDELYLPPWLREVWAPMVAAAQAA
jgi:hypothetical protein